MALFSVFSRRYTLVSPFAPCLVAGLSMAMLTGCGSSSSDKPAPDTDEKTSEAVFPQDQLPADLVPTLPLVVPENDLEHPLFSGIVHMNPSDDVTYCTFTDYIVPETTVFGETFGAQSPTGHHAILQYVTTPVEPHTGSCGAMDGPIMLGGTGGKSVKREATLPANFGVEVPAGAQLVINHHWINTTDEPVDGQAMVLARELPKGGDTVKAGSLPMLGFGWEIPAHGTKEYSTECTYQDDVKYVVALGHMHEWGKHVSIEVTRASGAVDSLIDEDWSPESATTAGGGNLFTLDDPFVVNKGDKVKLTCQWENDTTEALGFPREMCVFFGNTIGSNAYCINGAWMAGDVTQAPGGQDIINHL